MCDALRELFADELNETRKSGMEEGLECGIKALIQTCEELEIPKEKALYQVKSKFALTEAEADRYIKKYWTLRKHGA